MKGIGLQIMAFAFLAMGSGNCAIYGQTAWTNSSPSTDHRWSDLPAYPLTNTLDELYSHPVAPAAMRNLLLAKSNSVRWQAGGKNLYLAPTTTGSRSYLPPTATSSIDITVAEVAPKPPVNSGDSPDSADEPLEVRGQE